jgi:hypothetical protein
MKLSICFAMPLVVSACTYNTTINENDGRQQSKQDDAALEVDSGVVYADVVVSDTFIRPIHTTTDSGSEAKDTGVDAGIDCGSCDYDAGSVDLYSCASAVELCYANHYQSVGDRNAECISICYSDTYQCDSNCAGMGYDNAECFGSCGESQEECLSYCDTVDAAYP